MEISLAQRIAVWTTAMQIAASTSARDRAKLRRLLTANARGLSSAQLRQLADELAAEAVRFRPAAGVLRQLAAARRGL